MTFDPDLSWRLHHQVAVRPEPFGALLYHFGTRKLSFLKNRTIVEVVRSLADHPDARSACRAAGIDDARRRRTCTRSRARTIENVGTAMTVTDSPLAAETDSRPRRKPNPCHG